MLSNKHSTYEPAACRQAMPPVMYHAATALRPDTHPHMPPAPLRFLPEGCQLSIGQLCSGQGLAHADTSKVHQLEAQLVALAPQLAALAVALRATVLPALPWLAPEVASKLQVCGRGLTTCIVLQLASTMLLSCVRAQEQMQLALL